MKWMDICSPWCIKTTLTNETLVTLEVYWKNIISLLLVNQMMLNINKSMRSRFESVWSRGNIFSIIVSPSISMVSCVLSTIFLLKSSCLNILLTSWITSSIRAPSAPITAGITFQIRSSWCCRLSQIKLKVTH